MEARPGDLLIDGTRKEMNAAKYDAMTRINDAASNQWKRFALDGSLSKMMKNITNLQGGNQWKPLSRASSAESSAMLLPDSADTTPMELERPISGAPSYEFRDGEAGVSGIKRQRSCTLTDNKYTSEDRCGVGSEKVMSRKKSSSFSQGSEAW